MGICDEDEDDAAVAEDEDDATAAGAAFCVSASMAVWAAELIACKFIGITSTRVIGLQPDLFSPGEMKLSSSRRVPLHYSFAVPGG